MISPTLRVALLIFAAVLSSGCCKLLSLNSPAGSGGPNTNSRHNNGTGARTESATGEPAFTRPPLVVQRGQYFTWAMPAHWRANETGNGVDMNSPDGRLWANSVLLTGTPGTSTPWDFMELLLGKLGATNVRQLSAHDLPPVASGYPGINWEIQEFELAFTDAKGISQRANSTCGILNAYGSYSVVLQSVSAPEEDYDQAKTWLPLLPQSVAAIDPSKIAYQDQLIPVRNHPLDNSGLMESWEQKNLSQDRISKAQREGMMGYERMVSPTTGQHYNMPLETYDGTVGGYRNPEHPEEILKPTTPQE
ncbi:MAG TPA: hypothetical protein VHR36_07045 [Pyrinomonadaceae bacterium]|nr:hypothetical protein [Pyrinomonadaceae bacterium]